MRYTAYAISLPHIAMKAITMTQPLYEVCCILDIYEGSAVGTAKSILLELAHMQNY